MKFYIRSRKGAEKLCREVHLDWIVSLVDPFTPAPYLRGPNRVLQMRFFDETDGRQPYSPTMANMRAIVMLGRRFQEEDSILVHCEQGMSRSSASALALASQHYSLEKVKEMFQEYCGKITPNLYMAQMLDDILGKGGQLVELCRWFDNQIPNLSGKKGWT